MLEEIIKHGQTTKWNSVDKEFEPTDFPAVADANLQARALPADETRDDNALATVAGLSCDIVTGAAYLFEAALWLSDATFEGLKLDFGGGAGLTWFRATALGYDDTLSLVRQLDDVGDVVDSDGFSGMVDVKGSFVAAADGAFAPRFSQKNHAAGELLMLKGSYIKVREVI